MPSGRKGHLERDVQATARLRYAALGRALGFAPSYPTATSYRSRQFQAARHARYSSQREDSLTRATVEMGGVEPPSALSPDLSRDSLASDPSIPR